MVYIIDKCHTNYIIKMQFVTKDFHKLYQPLPKKGLKINRTYCPTGDRNVEVYIYFTHSLQQCCMGQYQWPIKNANLPMDCWRSFNANANGSMQTGNALLMSVPFTL